MIHWISGVASLINGESQKMKTKSDGVVAWLAVNSAVLYGLWKDAEWATTAVKAIAALGLLSGGIMALDPLKGLQLYGREVTPPLSTEFSLLIESYGSILAGGAVMMMAHASGTDVTKAIGYGFIPLVLVLAKSVFVTKKYQQANMDTAPLIGWIVIASTIIATLCF